MGAPVVTNSIRCGVLMPITQRPIMVGADLSLMAAPQLQAEQVLVAPEVS